VTVATGVLLLAAAFSETLGRILPLVARRHQVSGMALIRLLTAGTLVQASVFVAWPAVAWTLAALTRPGPVGQSVSASIPAWTAGSIAPLLFCAVLAFPLLGHALHALVLLLAGLALVERLCAGGIAWWPAAGCVGVAGVGLALVLAGVRRVVATRGVTPPAHGVRR
jgi:hypothetical protein